MTTVTATEIILSRTTLEIDLDLPDRGERYNWTDAEIKNVLSKLNIEQYNIKDATLIKFRSGWIQIEHDGRTHVQCELVFEEQKS